MMLSAQQWGKLAAGLVVLKVTVSILLSYGDYFPLDFQSEFLRGRESSFFGVYQWAFYAHLASGPPALVLGLFLMSSTVRRRFPRWHRRGGRLQAMLVLALLAPSGLVMAFYAAAGPIAGAGFAALAVATAVCLALGWRAAVRRRFAAHECWMLRGYLLLCSAVVLRLMGGLVVVTGLHADWIDIGTAWACWLLPLVGYEVVRRRGMEFAPS